MSSKQLKTSLAFGAAVFLTACEAQGTPGVMTIHSSQSFQNKVENANEQSVAYQVDTEHTGFARGPLRRPLTQLWSVKLDVGRQHYEITVIANGIVVVTANHNLIALDDQTGETLWSKDSPSGYGWIGPAYDNGTIFVSRMRHMGAKASECTPLTSEPAKNFGRPRRRVSPSFHLRQPPLRVLFTRRRQVAVGRFTRTMSLPEC